MIHKILIFLTATSFLNTIQKFHKEQCELIFMPPIQIIVSNVIIRGFGIYIKHIII